MNKIITVGREFGSGWREFRCRLAGALGYAYCDQEIVSEIINRKPFRRVISLLYSQIGPERKSMAIMLDWTMPH